MCDLAEVRTAVEAYAAQLMKVASTLTLSGSPGETVDALSHLAERNRELAETMRRAVEG